MSIKERDMLRDNIQFSVEEVWDLEGREDLLEDCVNYILDKFPDNKTCNMSHHDILELIIKFLLVKVCQCVSNKDLNKMEGEYNQQEISVEKEILEAIVRIGP